MKYQFGVDQQPHKRWPVAWYNPQVLWRAVVEMLSSQSQLRNLDRRELFSGEFQINDLTHLADGDDFWWDFMSDTGDGGNASYTIARAIQAPSITLAPANEPLIATPPALPRGRALILGGDLAYPGASPEEYQYRFVEMWEAARPAADSVALTVLGIPQNHDWFDNLSTYNRYFVGGYRDNFRAMKTPQTRSYFVARLPRGWWILGLDYALVGDLDRKQFEAFKQMIHQQLSAGDNVILLYPEPYWTRSLGDDARVGYPKRYQRLEAELLACGIKIRMRLAGDYHHYVRESAEQGAGLDYEDMLVTCGSGGAFLHPTHTKTVNRHKLMTRASDTQAMTDDLRSRVCVGAVNTAQTSAPAPSAASSESSRCYQHQCCYPAVSTSKKLSFGNIFALFKPAAMSGVFLKISLAILFSEVLASCAAWIGGVLLLVMSCSHSCWVYFIGSRFTATVLFSAPHLSAMALYPPMP